VQQNSAIYAGAFAADAVTSYANRIWIPALCRKECIVTDRRDELEALLKHEQLERVQDYAKRGRRFQLLPDAELVNFWVLTMNHWADGSSEFTSQDIDDCQSEMILRRIDPPFDRVSRIWERVTRRAGLHFNLIDNDPKARAVVEALLEEQLERLRLQADRPKH
jgi:hypothetical protein